MSQAVPILDQMSALSDGIRSRMLFVLEDHELTVSELCSVLQLPQSTVSRHLKTLSDAGWVVSRPDGPRRLYRMPQETKDSDSRELWTLARGQLSGRPAIRQDALRLDSVLAARRERSREFFDTAADRWDAMRDELFGAKFYLGGLLGLLDPDWTVGDLGCGSGPVTEALVPFVRRVVAVDDSRAMLDAARARLGDRPEVDLRQGRLESLPIEDASLDAATLVLVLHHLPHPAKVIAEVHRVLRPEGRLLILDMLPHDRQEYEREMGHVWMGFSPEQIETFLAATGFADPHVLPMSPDPAAKGPGLFTAVARKKPEETMETQHETRS